MIVKKFVTITTEDAESILNCYQYKSDDVEELFAFASDVRDSGQDEQFHMTITKELREWCRSLLKEEKDETGIFAHIYTI